MALLINPDFSRLSQNLDGLLAASAEESFFNHPAWYEVVRQSGMTPGEQAHVYSDAAARAALLLKKAGERRLASLTNVYSCEHAPLLTPSASGEAFDEIVGEIVAERPRWHSLLFAGLDPEAPAFATLAQALRRHCMLVRPYFDFGVWFEDTGGLTFAEYAAQRPTQLRNTWSRKRKRLAATGRGSLVVYDGPAQIEQGIADYETVYRASWKEPEPYPRFMPDLMRCSARLGALRLGIQYLDDVPAAAQIWIVWRGRATIFKLAHDDRFKDLSLGTILTMAMMERVLELDRPIEVNLGRGDDDYKKLWLPRRRERWGLLAANPRTAAGLTLGLREKTAELYRRLARNSAVPEP